MSRLADITVAIQEWVVSRLSASQELADALGVPLQDVPARLWDSTPDRGAPEPYVDIVVAEALDVGAVGQVEVMARAEVTVKLVGRTQSYEPLRAAATAVHNALQHRSGDPISGGGELLTSDRLRTIAYPEQAKGIEYRHLGGTYQVYAQ